MTTKICFMAVFYRETKREDTPPTPTRLNCRVSRCVPSPSAVWTEFATSSRRLPTDSVDNSETEHNGLTTVREIWSILEMSKSYFIRSHSYPFPLIISPFLPIPIPILVTDSHSHGIPIWLFPFPPIPIPTDRTIYIADTSHFTV